MESDWGIVSHFNNPRDFYVQYERDLEAIEKITEIVDEFVKASKSSRQEKKYFVNDFIVARWSEDGNWYRAVVDEAYETSYKVTFIDFGNSISVTSQDIISESTEQIFKDNAIAHRCCYYAREKTKLSDWEPILKKFEKEVSDDSRRFYIESVGFSLSHQNVRMYTSMVKKEKKLDLLSELQPTSNGSPTQARETTVKTKMNYPPVSKVSETELGMVVFVKTVDEFYVQVNRDENNLNSAYKELALLQSKFINRSEFVSQLKCSDPCVVLHSEDSCFYRGQVVSTKFDSANVKLVDFGEILDVPKNKIYSAPTSLLKYPPFGLHCRVNVNSQSRRELVYNVLQQLMESSSSVRIRFLTKTMPYTVILTAKGSDQIIAGDEESLLSTNGSGIASPSLPKQEKMTTGTRFYGTTVYETIETDCFFYLQTKSGEEESEKVQALLDSSELEILDLKSAKVGHPCVAPYEEVLYRAVIRSIGKENVELFFIDFGNTEFLPVDSEIYSMTSDLLSYPSLCLKCQLVCYQSFSDLPVDDSGVVLPADFEIVSGDEKLWTVKQVHGQSPPEIARYPGIQKMNDEFKASFSHVDSQLGNLSFCQTEEAIEQLDEVMNIIDSNADSMETLPASHVSIGAACVATHDDGELYRAEITSVSGKTATIRFVDFGNAKSIDLAELKTPPAALMKIPSLTVPILLSQSQLKAVEPDTVVYDIKLRSGNHTEGWKVTIPGIDANEVGDEVNEIKTEVAKYAEMTLTKGSQLCGYFTYIPDTCDELSYFQTPNMAEQLDNITASIEECMYNLTALPPSSAISGRPCLAQDVDEVFYRGLILSQADQNSTVLFVDYGTSRKIPSSDLKELPKKLSETPLCVIPIKLNSDQGSNIDLNREDYKLEIVEGNVEDGLIVGIDGVVPVACPKPKSVNPVTIDRYEKSSTIGMKLTGYFTYVSDDDQLSFFQTFEMADLLNDKVTPKIEELTNMDQVREEKIKIGQACLAQDVDDVFYRGVISEITGSDLKVTFVDYGTSRKISAEMVKDVPRALLSVPICVCPLRLSKAQSSAIDMNREDYVISLESGDDAGWQILIEGAQTTDDSSLESNIKQTCVTEDDRSKSNNFGKYKEQQLNQGDSLVGYFVYLADGRSCSYFQTFEMADTAATIDGQIADLIENCGSLETFDIGQICLAQDDDENFYRAFVTEKLGDDLFNVRFVDYGTSNKVSKLMMKILPETLTIPINVVPLVLTPLQQSSIDMNREDYNIKLQEGDANKGWSVIIEGIEAEKQSETVVSSDGDTSGTMNLDSFGFTQSSLKSGDQLTGYFTYLSHSTESLCYFQTHEMADQVGVISERLSSLLSTCKEVTVSDMKVGHACLAQDEDDVFYRGVVMEILGDNQFKVMFVDYGSYRNVPLALMRNIPEELIRTPTNILPVMLSVEEQTKIDMDREDYSLKLVENKFVNGWRVNMIMNEVTIDCANENDREDVKIEASQPSNEKYEFPLNDFQIGDSFTGFFTYLPNAEGQLTYFQTNDMSEKGAAISAEVLETLDNCEQATSNGLEIGSACLAQDVDEVFYRARITGKESDKYVVLFVDYGTVGTVDISMIKRINGNLSAINVLPVMLAFNQIESIEMNREDYRLTLVDGDEKNGWTVVINNDDGEANTSVAVVTVSIESDATSDTVPKITQNALGYARSALQKGDVLTGYFTFLSNNDDCMSYFQTEGMLEKATKLGEKISDILTDTDEVPESKIEVGLQCIAKDVDECYYRAVVTKRNESNQWEVLFVDFGTFGTPVDPLKSIPDELLSFPICTCPVLMNRQTMVKLNVNDTFSIRLVSGGEDNGWHVSLSQEITEISERRRSYPERKEKVGDILKCIALIISTSTKEMSYIQAQEDEQLNTKIDETISVNKEFEVIDEDLEVGQACLAPHSEDGLLYRASITALENEVSLNFVDWGNSRKAQRETLKKVPGSIIDIPPLSIPVLLTESQMNTMDMDNVYEVKFLSGSYASGWVIDFKVPVPPVVATANSPVKSPSSPLSPSSMVPDTYPCRAEVSTNFVKVSADQRTVHGTQLVSGIIIARPLPESSDPIHFRSTADEKQLRNMEERLESIVSNEDASWRLPRLPYELCVNGAACLVHDVIMKKWYRGQLTNVDSSNGTAEVRLVDHGTRVLKPVTFAQLHRLPKWLRQVAPLCLACHPRDADSWEVVRSKHNVLMRLVGVDSSSGAVTASFTPHIPYSHEQLLEIKDRVLSSDSFGTQSIPRQSPPSPELFDSTYGTVEANVTDVTDQGYFQVSLVAEYLNTKNFCDHVDSIYQLISECLVPVTRPIVNGAYVCRDSNGRYTRVRIVSLSTDKTYVLHFLDLGFTKTLSNVYFYFLFPHLSKEESRSWLCNAFTQSEISALSQEESSHIQAILSNHTLQMQYESNETDLDHKDKEFYWKPFRVSFPKDCLNEVIADGLTKVRSIIEDHANIQPSDECSGLEISIPRISAPRIAPSQRIEVRVTHVESLRSFWCRDVNSQKKIERIQGSLLASLGAASNPLENGDEPLDIVIGGYYALMSSWGWRRVHVLDFVNNQVTVQCIDDGQRTEVDRKALRYLPGIGAAVENHRLAMHCSLYGVKSATGNSTSDELCEKFKITHGTWIATVEQVVRTSSGHEEESLLCVSLNRSDGGSSLSNQLIQAEMAIPDVLDRNLSVSSNGSVVNDIDSECLDNEEVISFTNGVLHRLTLPTISKLPNEPVEILITRVHSCKDFSVVPVEELSTVHIEMKDLKELPANIDIDIYSSDLPSIWCSMVRANQLSRVLVTLPGKKSESPIKLNFVDEGVVEEVEKDIFLGGLHEMPAKEWLCLPRLAVKCSLYNSSGQNASPLFKRMHNKRQLSAFVNSVDGDLHVVSLLDRVDGVDVSSETTSPINETFNTSDIEPIESHVESCVEDVKGLSHEYDEHVVSLTDQLNVCADEPTSETENTTNCALFAVLDTIDETCETQIPVFDDDTIQAYPDDLSSNDAPVNDDLSSDAGMSIVDDIVLENTIAIVGEVHAEENEPLHEKYIPGESDITVSEVVANVPAITEGTETEMSQENVAREGDSKTDITIDDIDAVFVANEHAITEGTETEMSQENVAREGDSKTDITIDDIDAVLVANEPAITEGTETEMSQENVAREGDSKTDNTMDDIDAVYAETEMIHVVKPEETSALVEVLEETNVTNEEVGSSGHEPLIDYLAEGHSHEVFIEIDDITICSSNNEISGDKSSERDEEGSEVVNSLQRSALYVAVNQDDKDLLLESTTEDEELLPCSVVVDNLNESSTTSVVEVNITDALKESDDLHCKETQSSTEIPHCSKSFLELSITKFEEYVSVNCNPTDSDEEISDNLTDVEIMGPFELDTEIEDDENKNPLSAFELKVRTADGTAMHLSLAFVYPRNIEAVTHFRNMCLRESENGLFFIPSKPLDSDGSKSCAQMMDPISGLLFFCADAKQLCRSINVKLVTDGVAEVHSS